MEFTTSLLLGAEFYELTSVICHKGKDLAQGHYVCYILRDGSWYLYDDTRIQSVREEEVLSCEPYLMIFEKKQVNTTNIAEARPSDKAKSSSKEAEITGNATSDEAKVIMNLVNCFEEC